MHVPHTLTQNTNVPTQGVRSLYVVASLVVACAAGTAASTTSMSLQCDQTCFVCSASQRQLST